MTLWYKTRHLFYYKMQQKFITKCVRFFITKCDTLTTKRDSYYKMRQLLQNATFITDCDSTSFIQRAGVLMNFVLTSVGCLPVTIKIKFVQSDQLVLFCSYQIESNYSHQFSVFHYLQCYLNLFKVVPFLGKCCFC